MFLNLIKKTIILEWIIATFSGFLLSLFFVEIGTKPDLNLLLAATAGLIVSLPQAFLVKEYLPAIWWVLLTSIAWVVIDFTGLGAVGWMVPTTDVFLSRILHGAFEGVITGFLLGCFQWIILGPYVENSWRWILLNTISWAIALPVGYSVGLFLYRLTNIFLAEVLGLVISWLILACLLAIGCRFVFDNNP
jgi:hypothetical protein